MQPNVSNILKSKLKLFFNIAAVFIRHLFIHSSCNHSNIVHNALTKFQHFKMTSGARFLVHFCRFSVHRSNFRNLAAASKPLLHYDNSTPSFSQSSISLPNVISDRFIHTSTFVSKKKGKDKVSGLYFWCFIGCDNCNCL